MAGGNAELERMAHDIRTPLTALKMASTLLSARRKGKADAEELALLQAIERNVERLEDLTRKLTTPRALESPDGTVRQSAL